MRYLTSILCLALIATSCKEDTATSQKEAYQNLYEEVMKIHDDVMPETNNLYRLKKYAQENIEVLPDTSQWVKKLVEVQVNASKADEVMMEWMAQFKVPEGDHDLQIQYLKKEKESITEVRDVMLTTLHDGKAVIRASDDYIKANKLREDGTTSFYPK